MGIGENGQAFRRTMLTVRQLFSEGCNHTFGIPAVMGWWCRGRGFENPAAWDDRALTLFLRNDYDFVIIRYRQAGSKYFVRHPGRSCRWMLPVEKGVVGRMIDDKAAAMMDDSPETFARRSATRFRLPSHRH